MICIALACCHLASYFSIFPKIQDPFPSGVLSLLSPTVFIGKFAMKLCYPSPSQNTKGFAARVIHLAVGSISGPPRRWIQEVTCNKTAFCAYWFQGNSGQWTMPSWGMGATGLMQAGEPSLRGYSPQNNTKTSPAGRPPPGLQSQDWCRQQRTGGESQALRG